METIGHRFGPLNYFIHSFICQIFIVLLFYIIVFIYIKEDLSFNEDTWTSKRNHLRFTYLKAKLMKFSIHWIIKLLLPTM